MSTIPEVGQDANELYSTLVGDLAVDLDLPELVIDTNFQLPPVEGNPAYDEIPTISLDALTTREVGGSGVFDALMEATAAHLHTEHEKGRLTGRDYAEVYTAAISSIMAQATQFLLSKDRAYWESLNAQANLKIAQAQAVRAAAEVEMTRLNLQTAQLNNAKVKLEAATIGNQYVLSKMSLVTGYNDILKSEGQIRQIEKEVELTDARILLTGHQADSERARTHDTLLNGQPIRGLVSMEKMLAEARAETAKEELDAARAQTKDTLSDGISPIGGMLALEKEKSQAEIIHLERQGELVEEQVDAARAQTKQTLKAGGQIQGILKWEMTQKEAAAKLTSEQHEAARAQTRNTLSTGEQIQGLVAVEKQIKEAQKTLTTEQADAARAQTKDTLAGGAAITGLLAKEKLLREKQAKLVDEQYESQRAQTRGTLSSGEQIVGVLGAQTKLYEQQITSYKRDGENKAMKLLMDSWIARKTIDDGVLVPSGIDTQAINTMLSKYRGNLDLD